MFKLGFKSKKQIFEILFVVFMIIPVTNSIQGSASNFTTTEYPSYDYHTIIKDTTASLSTPNPLNDGTAYNSNNNLVYWVMFGEALSSTATSGSILSQLVQLIFPRKMPLMQPIVVVGQMPL